MHFVALNAHYHTVEIVSVAGRFKMAGQEMAGEIELRGGNNGVTHGEETRFIVQQWITLHDAERITLDDGKHVVIQTNVLDIHAVATDPTTAERAGEFRVRLPSQIQFDKENRWAAAPPIYEQLRR